MEKNPRGRGRGKPWERRKAEMGRAKGTAGRGVGRDRTLELEVPNQIFELSARYAQVAEVAAQESPKEHESPAFLGVPPAETEKTGIALEKTTVSGPINGESERMSEDEIKDAGKEVLRDDELPSAQRVLQNDLLLDKILHFAMDDDDVERQMKTTKSCKLVKRLWLERTCVFLQKSPPAWYNVQLELYDDEFEDVKKFIKTFGKSQAGRIPPFTLHSYFAEEWEITDESIYSLLIKCITQCGAGLLKLNLEIEGSDYSENDHDSRPIIHSLQPLLLYLPKLESVEVYVVCDSSARCENVCERAKHLLDSVLARSECLREFVLVVCGDEQHETVLPVELENLELPHTLTAVYFRFYLKPGLFSNFLLRHPLPNLTCLIAWSTKCRIGNEIELVLNKFRHQLKRLQLDVNPDWRDSSHSTTMLPMMECLISRSIDKRFPVLRKIFLHGQAYEMCKWFQNANFWSVRKANFMLTPKDYSNSDRHDSQLVQQMQLMKQAVPNVIKLTLVTVFTLQLSHLKFIFREMRQLQELKIEVMPLTSSDNMTLDEFDCVFLGLSPEEEVSSLDAQREEWKSLAQASMPALRKLEVIIGHLVSSLGWNLKEEELNERLPAGNAWTYFRYYF